MTRLHFAMVLKIKRFVFISLLCSLVCRLCAGIYHMPIPPKRYSYESHTIRLSLNHFNATDTHCFDLRYLRNSSFVTSTQSMILLHTGGNDNVERDVQNMGFIWELAEQLEALVIFAEHRFYGNSYPVNTQDVTASYTKYLRIELALADYAQLLKQLNPERRRPVFTIGGGYAGVLAALMRIKYAHLVWGAVASSAPLGHINGETSCSSYYSVLTELYRRESYACGAYLYRIFRILETNGQSLEGRAFIYANFQLCAQHFEPAHIMEFLQMALGYIAMANLPYAASIFANLPAKPLTAFCKRLQPIDSTDAALLRALHWAMLLYMPAGKGGCLDFGLALGVQSYTDKVMWPIQQCIDAVMPLCADSRYSAFPGPTDFSFTTYSQACYEKFQVRPYDLQQRRRRFGYLQLYGNASRVLFTNGHRDPWYYSVIYMQPNPHVYVRNIADGVHHNDLLASKTEDPNSVRQARLLIALLIVTWQRNFHDNAEYAKTEDYDEPETQE